MLQGTVSEFDPRGGFGLIDSDDGDIVFFNRNNVEAFDASLLSVGRRVQFVAHQERLGPHADLVLVEQ